MENFASITRVLKAPTKPITNFASLQILLPLLASFKLDGIRCITHPKHGPVSQKMLPIPNLHVRKCLKEHCPPYLDGELVTYTNGKLDDFNAVQSKIMSRDGDPDFHFMVFDSFKNIYDPFHARYAFACEQIIENRAKACMDSDDPEYFLQFLKQHSCETLASVELFERIALAQGYEGIMLRRPGGWYKEGRSTEREGYLLKVKRFLDDEAVVIGIKEAMENCNPATKDANGLIKRSKHAANMKGKGMVGMLECRWHGLTFGLSGFTEAQAVAWWLRPEKIIGERVTFTYQPHGTQTLPRSPKFKGIRYD